jgi:hypothetical protein
VLSFQRNVGTLFFLALTYKLKKGEISKSDIQVRYYIVDFIIWQGLKMDSFGVGQKRMSSGFG